MNETPTLTFVEAIKRVFSKYADFSGRARRSEFWWWYLFNMIINAIFMLPVQILMNKKQALIDAAMTGQMSLAEVDAADPTSTIIAILVIFGIVSLALLIPTLAVWVRRLHDVGKSGHMLWLILVCGIGGLIPLIMCIGDGQPQPNQYGPSPKMPEAPRM